jgi:hypothetical protein
VIFGGAILPSPIEIYVNQVGYNLTAPKMAVVGSASALTPNLPFTLVDSLRRKVFSGALSGPFDVPSWATGKSYYRADFSKLYEAGNFTLELSSAGQTYTSFPIHIGDRVLLNSTLASIVGYYHEQRANTSQELEADRQVQLYGSDERVDMHGGWCDASGDVSKYFSHLAYSNFLCPQQTPMVVWSMASLRDANPAPLHNAELRTAVDSEALWGADYLMRAQAPEGYFRMIIFSYFNKDPHARRVVGLLANSVTNTRYQAAFRTGGGMAIAALARVSRWKKSGDFTSKQYLAAAERAFDHLLTHNLEYDEDHKENILDDYCALAASTELWLATGKTLYRDEARKRASHLEARITGAGYFLADNGKRPFWHAADAGLPVVALCRYLDAEHEGSFRKRALDTIRHALDYQLKVTDEVPNPFGYARQSFLYQDQVQNGFFIPHENETGWWWQGENARLSSLATAAIVGGRLVYPGSGPWGVKPALAEYAERQLSWILGCNPYSLCFMYGFGENNVPYMHSNFGHGSEKGGISNGITGKEGNPDGSGIDFKLEDNGNEWRWTEQWLPHAAWFLQALAATEKHE